MAINLWQGPGPSAIDPTASLRDTLPARLLQESLGILQLRQHVQPGGRVPQQQAPPAGQRQGAHQPAEPRPAPHAMQQPPQPGVYHTTLQLPAQPAPQPGGLPQLDPQQKWLRVTQWAAGDSVTAAEGRPGAGVQGQALPSPVRSIPDVFRSLESGVMEAELARARAGGGGVSGERGGDCRVWGSAVWGAARCLALACGS
jgi:hypothetical protein